MATFEPAPAPRKIPANGNRKHKEAAERGAADDGAGGRSRERRGCRTRRKPDFRPDPRLHPHLQAEDHQATLGQQLRGKRPGQGLEKSGRCHAAREPELRSPSETTSRLDGRAERHASLHLDGRSRENDFGGTRADADPEPSRGTRRHRGAVQGTVLL